MSNIKIQVISAAISIAIVAGLAILLNSSIKMPAVAPSSSLVITKEEAVSLINQKQAVEQVEAELKTNGVEWEGEVSIGTPEYP